MGIDSEPFCVRGRQGNVSDSGHLGEKRARAEESRPKRSRGYHRLFRGSRARLLFARNATARGLYRDANPLRRSKRRRWRRRCR